MPQITIIHTYAISTWAEIPDECITDGKLDPAEAEELLTEVNQGLAERHNLWPTEGIELSEVLVIDEDENDLLAEEL